jgi:hypothetical protein
LEQFVGKKIHNNLKLKNISLKFKYICKMSIIENNEIQTIYSKSQYRKIELLLNLDNNNSIDSIFELNNDTLNKNIANIESFRKFYLFQTKKYHNGEGLFGLVHIRLAFFVKEEKRYKNYIETLIQKVDKAIKISNNNNNIKGKFYIYMDLENVNPRNFSRKFFKKVSKILDARYNYQLKKFFISGKEKLIKLFWPIISLFLDNKVKKKIVYLK